MNGHRQKTTFLVLTLLAVGLAGVAVFWPAPVFSGPYLSSSHANTTYGVNRTSLLPFSFPKGSCIHCHEQHGSVDGSEPDPTGGPDPYALFYASFTGQTDNFCMQCHTDLSTFQSGGLVNRSYSYRAGGWAADTLNDIQEAFTYTSPPNPPAPSAHDLSNMRTFLLTQAWGYNSDSNPCAACHNAHRATGDPANLPNAAKSNATRGWPLSRPSQHSSDNNAWGLWGDDPASERMNVYTPGYQALYRFGSSAAYEPDGSTIQNGSNLTDFVTFCTDCHNATNTIASTPVGRNLYTINWTTEMHGNGVSVNNGSITEINAPYQELLLGTYVLSCMDCHESHGSPNNYLIRKQINTATVTGLVSVTSNGTGSSNTEWVTLCQQCHANLIGESPSVHVHPNIILGDAGCSSARCHPGGTSPVTYRNCGDCHFHGNSTIDLLPYGRFLF